MSNNTHEINKAIITKRSKIPIIVSNMDGVLVNKTINASIDNANIIGKVHQYSIKNRFIVFIYLISSNSPVSESMMKPRTTMSLGTSG